MVVVNQDDDADGTGITTTGITTTGTTTGTIIITASTAIV